MKAPAGAPKQADEGAPEAVLVIEPEFAAGLTGLEPGDDVIVLTWLDRADRDVVVNHPRSDRSRPVAGVFTTRSPHRPNPIGLHQVAIAGVDAAACACAASKRWMARRPRHQGLLHPDISQR